MSSRSINLERDLHAYLCSVSVREHEVLAKLRVETEGLEWSGMQISPEQGQFMALLVELIGARRALEVGVFTGYSTLCVALALPHDGRVVACDVSEEWTAVARRHWAEAGVEERIDLRLAPAIDTLDALLADGQAGSYDFAFIDADKRNYPGYYERCFTLLRPGGLLAIDNTLWQGRVLDESDTSEETLTIRALNGQLRDDSRVTLSLLPVGDGLTLARKR